MGPRLELKNQTRLYAGNSLPGALVTNGVVIRKRGRPGVRWPGAARYRFARPFWSG